MGIEFHHDAETGSTYVYSLREGGEAAESMRVKIYDKLVQLQGTEDARFQDVDTTKLSYMEVVRELQARLRADQGVAVTFERDSDFKPRRGTDDTAQHVQVDRSVCVSA